MDNKLSELKDVADYWRKVKSGELPAPGPNEISITVCTLDGAVSRIASLLAELEEKDKRITALDVRNAELNSRMDSWAVDRAESANRIDELETRLATPVRLPEREFDDGSDKQACILAGRFNSGIDKSAKAIRAAGFKCVGDE